MNCRGICLPNQRTAKPPWKKKKKNRPVFYEEMVCHIYSRQAERLICYYGILQLIGNLAYSQQHITIHKIQLTTKQMFTLFVLSEFFNIMCLTPEILGYNAQQHMSHSTVHPDIQLITLIALRLCALDLC